MDDVKQKRLLRDFRELGKIVREERRRQKMTQRELADLAGISRETLWKLEAHNGNIRLSTAVRVVGLLGLGFVIEKRSE